MSVLITDAGIAASIKARELGVSYKITHIGIGLEGYIPTVDQTELKNEIAREALSRGAVPALGQLHFEAVFSDNKAFEGKEIGYFLEDGTLFAIDSRNGEIMSLKRSNTIITEAFELNLAGSTIQNITVDLIGMPYATEEVAGIVQLNNTVTSTSDLLALTAKMGKRIWDKAASAYEIAASKMTQITADERYLFKQGIAADSNKLNGAESSTLPTPYGVVRRDGSGDIQARVFRFKFPDSNEIKGGLVFRHSVDDDITRVCSDVGAIKGFLGISSVVVNINNSQEILPNQVYTMDVSALLGQDWADKYFFIKAMIYNDGSYGGGIVDWAEPGWHYNASGATSRGVRCVQVGENNIVVSTGSEAICGNAVNDKSPFGNTLPILRAKCVLVAMRVN
mgnify:CR=1 FL=1|tara:strand:- start:735 stop:1916 length:1182 start_codon:yes stop_codon:yes gene_type:complete